MLKRPACCAVIVMMTGVLAGPSDAASLKLTLEKAADGVYVHRGEQAETSAANRGDIANVGFIVGSRCVAVIDTGGSRAIGDALLAAIQGKTDKPVCYVINTHVHPDHTFGDSAFADSDAKFVGHTNFPAALAARRDGYRSALERMLGANAAGSEIVAPNLLVEPGKPLELDVGGRKLRVQAWPTAHTDNDLTVFDEYTRTLWTGDLLFIECIPVIDGKVLGWLKVIDSLRELKPAHLIPGHGPINRPFEQAFSAESSYLDTVITKMRSAIKMGITLQEAVDSNSDSESRDSWLLFDDYHRRNLTAAYTELEWED